MNLTIVSGSKIESALLDLINQANVSDELIHKYADETIKELVELSVRAKFNEIIRYSINLNDRRIENMLYEEVKKSCEDWVSQNIKSSNIDEVAKSVAQWSIGNLPSLIVSYVLEGAQAGLKETVQANYVALTELRAGVGTRLNMFTSRHPVGTEPLIIREFTGETK